MPHALVTVLQQGLREYSGRQGALMATLCSWEGAQRVCGSSWYVPCVFIRLPVYPDFLQTLQLTLRPFDDGCRELEGADSFLCEEFGRKLWRQRVAFDWITCCSCVFTYHLSCGAHVIIPRAPII